MIHVDNTCLVKLVTGRLLSISASSSFTATLSISANGWQITGGLQI
ncbi:hypothetical protein [Niabella drilacis]|nr:hypothetical protein [Niabella drilacis]